MHDCFALKKAPISTSLIHTAYAKPSLAFVELIMGMTVHANHK